MAITRVDPWVGGFGIDITNKLTLESNATLTVGNGTSTGNVNVGNSVGICTTEPAYNLDVSGTFNTTSFYIGGTQVTATAAELNILDGVTATTTEINYVDGVTSNIQTQLDGKQASGSYLTGNQTITLSGDATGSGTTAITVTVVDDSHNHIISNVDGLQTALDAKDTVANVYATYLVAKGGIDGANTAISSNDTDITNLVTGLGGANTNITAVEARRTANIAGAVSSITTGNLTASRALASDVSGKVAVSTATSTELGYVSGVTSAIQTQLNARLPLSGGTMTGNIVMSGAQTVDGRDLSADGTKLDGIESGATADQTAAEILTAIKTVDGAGSGLDADLLDGISSASFLRSDTSDSFTSGTLTISGTALRLNDSVELEFGSGGGGTDAQIAWSGTALEFDVSGGPLYLDMGNDNDFYIRDVNSALANSFTVDVSAGDATALTNVNASNGKLQEGGNALIPAGSIIMYGAAAAPGGWYLCEGGAISRSTYAALFSAIGTTYGVGDGSTTFNVPDFRDRAPYGASTFLLGSKTAGEVDVNGQNSTGTGTSGSTGGSTVASTTGSDGPTTHSVTTSTTNSTTDKDVTNSITVVTGVSAHSTHTHSIPSLTVNGHTHSVPALTVTHPGVAVKFIIKT